jgi:hypothetical protein
MHVFKCEFLGIMFRYKWQEGPSKEAKFSGDEKIIPT